MRAAALVVGLAAVVTVVTSSSPASAGDGGASGGGGGVIVRPVDPGGGINPPAVGVGVTDPGQQGRLTTTASRGGAAPVCQWLPAPGLEAWLRRLPSRLPARGPDRVDPRARLLARVCGGVVDGYVWSTPGGPAQRLPEPATLARQAYALLRLPLPVPDRSPNLRLSDGRAAALVGEHTWLWTDRSVFVPRSRQLRVGPVWARVTAAPVGLDVDPGDGSPPVACAGPGTPFVPGRDAPHAPSPTCDVVYQRSSVDRPGGLVTGVWAIRWRVSWVGGTVAGPESGVLEDMISRTTAVFAVAEAQALVSE